MTSQNDTDYILSGVNLTDIDDLVSYKSSDVAYATPGTFYIMMLNGKHLLKIY